MVMDYVQGQTLSEFIRNTARKGDFPSAEQIVYIFSGVSMAIDYAHKQGMIHRDIKPANILLDQRPPLVNPLGKPVLIDFGIARLTGAESGTVLGTLMGTPHYISPEQAQGHHGNHASDLYSLGIILYEITTGVTPFRGDSTIAVIMQHIHELPTPPALINPNIPPALSAIILKSIAKQPEERFPSATAMTIALAEALHVPVPAQLRPDHASTPFNWHTSSNRPASSPHNTPQIYTGTQEAYTAPIEQGHADPLTPARPTYTTMAEPATNAQQPFQEPSTPVIQHTPKPERPKRLVMVLSALLACVCLLAGVGTYLYLSHPASQTTTGPVGQVGFSRSGHITSGAYDQMTLDLHTIPNPPSGQVYYAWIDSGSNENFRPHWLLVLDHGSVHMTNLTYQGSNNLLQPNTILLVTLEKQGNDPVVPSPILTDRRYYARLAPVTEHMFAVQSCPTGNTATICLQ